MQAEAAEFSGFLTRNELVAFLKRKTCDFCGLVLMEMCFLPSEEQWRIFSRDESAARI